MDKKPLTDWLYRWVGEAEATPNLLYWFVDTSFYRKQRLVVLFPFCLLYVAYSLIRSARHRVENRLYSISKRRNQKWYKEAMDHGYDIAIRFAKPSDLKHGK